MSRDLPALPRGHGGDLSVTALYTSGAQSWGGLPGAELLATKEARIVFRFTNAALCVVRLFRRRLPSLRCSLVQRHLMIDRLVREAAPRQVLELAAGLSRRGAAFGEDASLRYVEVDLPHVAAIKRSIFERSEPGRAVLARGNFRLVAADVAEAPLDDHVAPGQPLFVIAEGLFMYLQPEAQRTLWAKVRRLFDRAPGAFVFDLVPACEQPAPGILGRALERLFKLFTRGRTIERDARTRDDIAAEIRAAGFASVELVEPSGVASAWKLPFEGVKTQALLFVCKP